MIDFSPWNAMLHQYVDTQGRVDYASWQQTAMQDLQEWLHDLAANDEVRGWFTPSLRDRATTDTQLAFWLNVYNALTIAQVLQRYPISSIQPKVLGIPNWLAFLRFFTRPIYQLNGQGLSLNAIEHGILRQQWTEPRIHFALVCAAMGCPWLRNEAYFPDQVQSQLESDAMQFINNPAKVRYDNQTHILYCSKIFQWYGKDFLNVALSIPDYIQRYLSNKSELNDHLSIRYLSYDWNLNQRTS